MRLKEEKPDIWIETSKKVYNKEEQIQVSYDVKLSDELSNRDWVIVLANASDGDQGWKAMYPGSTMLTSDSFSLEKLEPGAYEMRIFLEIPPSRNSASMFENLLTKASFKVEGKIEENAIPIPENWAKGTLYNSNDGSCNYKGKYLIFMNAMGGKFKNLVTGEINQFMIVAPGAKLEVAAPASGAFIRVFLSSSSTATTATGERISFGSLSQLTNGWWFSAGCKNGTRPAIPCDSGNGQGTGNDPFNCSTLGEGY